MEKVKLVWRLAVVNEIESGVLNASHIEPSMRNRKLINYIGEWCGKTVATIKCLVDTY